MVVSTGTVRMSQMWMLKWVILLVGLQLIQADFMTDYGVTADPMDFSWPTTTTTVRASNHLNSICSMWGNFHFKTFDGDVYRFPGMCEYNLVSDCQSLFRQFSVHVKRTEHTNDPKISRVSVSINNIVVELTEKQVMINEKKVTLPVHVSGILVEENTIYTRLYSKMGITVTWNKEDAVMVELDSKYSNRTCGLCGDFNGVPVYNEFIESGRRVGYTEFGNKHRVPNPTHNCEDPFENIDEQNVVVDQCEKYRADCADLLEDEKWSSCSWVLSREPYIKACTNDICSRQPEGKDRDTTALCATLSEYSRQCSHAGGSPPTWRTAKFCAVTCPYNMVHSESGSPCMDTCSHKDTNTMCEKHNIDGCFCPPGTVFDEISNTGCIPVKQCQCKHDRIYNPGEVLYKVEEKCICEKGNWICMSIPGPGLCAVEEGSHFTTYDGKEFTFHGECNYVLSKDNEETKFIILGQIDSCVTLTGTCLKSIEVLFYNDKKNRLVIKDDGTVQHNAKVSLPYMAADFTVFRPSSFHIILQTTFGLQVQIQLVPLMQVYITVEQIFKGKTCGLCGNFNKVLSDDLKTPQGVVEGTAVSFANAWKALSNCPDRSERMDDPCSYSSDSEHFAEHWCSKMKDKESLFAKCHTTVNPDSYYKRCKYSSCTCEKSEECLCTVFSSYARACAAKEIFLQGWRGIVCEKYTENCPASQNYFYQLQSCQRTCLSLASERQSCSVDFVPVDGCACPDGFYQDENGLCVPMEKCSCYHRGETVRPGTSININNEHCVCVNGTLHCQSWNTRILECATPKVFFNCSTADPNEHGLKCAQTCMQKEVDCFSMDCESGCQCPTGLLDDGRGNCVKHHDCPCPHNGQIYEPGTEITVDCNTCTCQQGTWKCTENSCPGICTIYGSGHYKTFDQQRFGFRGDCSYIAAQDKCGNKTGNFHVITENIPCGNTGTTCSKAVVIILGITTLKLSGRTVTVSNTSSGPQINYKERNIGMYVVINTDIGLTVLWDRKTTVHIILQPQHRGEVCGLCGNFNGDGKDDFTTQGSLQTPDIIEFVDSWKKSSDCPDAAPDFDPCLQTKTRVPWAKLKCIIIMEKVFNNCHNKVDPNPYYENCVKDSCACNTGGDCECFCTAVAAYAQACNEAGVYVDWRTPEICPVYCDYYNEPGECTWHYSPFTPCYKTCFNTEGICDNSLRKLEGCYPKCPEEKPFFDEKNQVCVKKCHHMNTTSTPTPTPIPTSTGISSTTTGTTPPSTYTTTSTTTTTPMPPTSTEIPSTTSTTTGTTPTSTFTTTSTTTTTPMPHTSTEIPSTTSTTTGTTPTSTFTTTSTTTTTPMPPTSTEIPSTTSTRTGTTPTSTSSPRTTVICVWSDWLNSEPGGKTDNETYENIEKSGEKICKHPYEIECRNVEKADMLFDDFIKESKQVVQCNVSSGLMCKKELQTYRPFKCLDYKIRVCCVNTTNNVTTPPSTYTTTSTTTTTPMRPTSTEIPSTTSTTTGTTPPSTFTTTSTTTTTPMPPTSTEIPSTTGTTPTTTFTTTSTTTTTPMPPTSTEIPSTTSTTTGTTPTSTFTTTSTTTTTPMPPTSTEIPSTTSTTTGTTPTSRFTTTSTTTTTPMPHTSTEIPSTTSTTTGTTPTSTFTTTSTTTTTPMPPTSTEIPSTTSTRTGTTPTSTSSPRTTVICVWSDWLNSEPGGKTDNETYENIEKSGEKICKHPYEIECRNVEKADMLFDDFIKESKQVVQCNVSSGLMCKKELQTYRPFKCLDYKIRVCCVNTTNNVTTPPSTYTTTSTTTTTPMRPTSTEIPSTTSTTTGTTPPSTFTTTSTTTTTPMRPTSTEIPSTTSTTTGTTPTSTFTTTSTTTTTPMPPTSTEIPSTTSTTTGTTPPSTYTTTSTTTTTPMRPTSTEIPSTTSTTTGTTPPSTFTTTSTTTTTPMPPTSTEIPSTTSTTGTTPPSTYTTTSTTTTTPMRPTSTEIPSTTSTTTGTTPPSTFTTTSTTTTTPMPPTSTEIPSTTSTTTGTTPTSTFTTTSTTTTTPMPPTSTEIPSTTSTTTGTTPTSTFTTTSTTTTTPMPPTSTEIPSTTGTTPTSTFTTTSTTTTTPMPPTSTEIPSTTSTRTGTTPTSTSSPRTTVICVWSDWLNSEPGGKTDNETYENIEKSGEKICKHPYEIECRNVEKADMLFDDFIKESKQVVQCNVSSGLMCKKELQTYRPFKCLDYKIRVCCVNTTNNVTTPPSTYTTTSTTTTTPMRPTSTEIPSTTSTTTGTTPPSTFTTTSTTTTTPMPPTSTEIPSTTGTTPTTTFTTTSTTTTTPMPPTSTEIPSTTSTTTGTTPTSTFTTTSTTTTTPMPPTSTEIPSTTSTTTGTTPTSTFTTTSTTTTTPMPPTSTEIPSTTSTTTGTTPTSTFTNTSTTTTTPMPPTSTEIPSTTGTTPTSTFTTTSTTTTTPMPPTSTEIPSTTGTRTGTTPTSTSSPRTTVICVWSDWLNSEPGGKTDNETYENIEKSGEKICKHPYEIECRNVEKADMLFDDFIKESKQVVQCNVSSGLMCKKELQTYRPFKCLDYKIRVCCVNTTNNVTTPPSTYTTTSTTTTTPMRPTSTEIPSTTSTTTGTTPPSTFTTTSTTTTTPMPPTSTKIPSTTSTTTGTTPTSTFTTTSTTTTTPIPSTSTEIPSTSSTTTGTTTTSTFTTTSTTTTTPMPPTSTEIPSTTTTTGTTPTSAFTTTSTTTTTRMPPTSTEIPSTTSTTTGTTPTSTLTTTSTTTTTPMPPTSTEIPSTTSTTTGTTPTSTFTTTSTTTTTPMPPTSTEIPSTTSITTGTTPTSTLTTTSTTTTTPMPPTSTEIPSTTGTTPPSTFTTTSTTTTTPMPPTSTEIPSTTTTTGTTPTSTFTTTSTTTTTPMPPTSTEIPSTTSITTGTTPTSTFTTTSTTTTTPTPSPTPHDCPKWNKTTNEIFHITGCTMAKCIKGDVIEIIPFQCPPLQSITCKYNQPPVLVYDEHQCCQQYACDCFCEGWGDPHYITFDGFYYTYQGNCTYILMEEIRPKHYLKIYIDNVYCDPIEHVSCPRSIIVSYNKQVITLRNHRFMGGADLEALKDNVKLKLPYTYNGVRVISSTLDLFLEIPEIKVVVTFGITGFGINLPFQHFGKNTQGHCGTCNNNTADDCMIPGGTLVNDCAVMADYWTTSGVDGKNCTKPPVWNMSTPEPKKNTPTTPCQAHPDCYLLKSKLFEACHSHVSPDNFFLACQYDSCHMSNPALVCASLQSYARACSQLEVCIHWRNYTNLCNIICPGNQILLPCGPSEPPTCRDGPMQSTLSVLTEGCFCPENTTLFNKESGLCVPQCGCIDPSGTPRKFGEHFKLICEDCICDEARQSVICKPMKCPDVNPESCTEPGFMLVNVTDSPESCCSKQVCNCNVSMCPSSDKKCGVGYLPVLEVPNGKCCPEIRCEPKSVCVRNNMEYEPGTKITDEHCVECNCEMDKDPQTQLHIVKCSPKVCPKDICPQMFKYVKKEGECCGSCTQDGCIYDAPNNTKHFLQDGSEDKYKCETLTCHQINGSFVIEKTTKQCPPFNPDDCVPGTKHLDKEGCCEICKPRNCVLKKNVTRLHVNNCTSIDDVELTSCTGHCDTKSMYSMEKNIMNHSCSCCLEETVKNREVMLKCANSSEILHHYMYVESCSCTPTKCGN